MRSRGVPALSRTFEGPLDFSKRRHAARENDRFAVAPHQTEVRQIRDLARGDLESVRAELGEKLDALRVEAAGEELDSAVLAMGYERLMHVARELQPTQHRMLGFTVGRGLPLVRRFHGSGSGDAICPERLELDQIRARVGGRIDQSASQGHVAVMVDSRLGDDQRHVCLSWGGIWVPSGQSARILCPMPITHLAPMCTSCLTVELLPMNVAAPILTPLLIAAAVATWQ